MNRQHVFVALVAWRLCQSAVAQTRPTEAIEADREAAEAEVRDLERRARSLDDQSALRREQLQKRIRALYKLSGGGYLRALASTTDVPTLEAREAGLRRLMQRDLDELAAIRDESRQLDEEQGRRGAQIQRSFQLAAEIDRSARNPALDAELARPVDGKVIGAFGAYKDPETGHEFSRRGVELEAKAGLRVRAPAAGTVSWVGEVGGLGHVAVIDLGNGYTTLVGRMRKVGVTQGTQVRARQSIGEAGQSTVYIELAHQTTAIDPAPLLPPLIRQPGIANPQ